MEYKTALFIRDIRKKRQFSLRKLASLCNIPVSSLSDIENSRYKISSKHIEKLITSLQLKQEEIDVFLKYATLDRSEIFDKTIIYLVSEEAIYNHVKEIYGYEINSDRLNDLKNQLSKTLEYFIKEDIKCQL